MEKESFDWLSDMTIPDEEKAKIMAKLQRIQEKILNEAGKIAQERVSREGEEFLITVEDLNQVFRRFSNLIERVDENRIKKSILRGREWLLKERRVAGAWGWWSWLEPPELEKDSNLSKIWSTAITLRALLRSGYPSDSPEVIFGMRWLLDNRNESGGWGRLPLSYDSKYPSLCFVPNTYETSCVLLTFLEAKQVLGVDLSIIPKVVDLLEKHQRGAGDWPKELTAEEKERGNIDIGATCIALSALSRANIGEKSRIIRGVEWLENSQNPKDGGWGFAPGYPSVTTKTCDALRSLLGAGVDPEDSHIQRGIRWLLENQGPIENGRGWGWRRTDLEGRMIASDVENTAFSIIALLRAGFSPSLPTVQAAIRWLILRQEQWKEDTPRVIFSLCEYLHHITP